MSKTLFSFALTINLSIGAGCLVEADLVDEGSVEEPFSVDHPLAGREDIKLAPQFSMTMSGLAPQAWWRFGETSGSNALDSSGNGHTGAYHNTPLLGSPGAIIGNSNGSVRFRSTQSEYVEVPDHSAFSLARAHDGFGRTVSQGSSWGTADAGGSWTPDVSFGSYYAVGGGHARIDETSASGTWEQVLSGVNRTQYDLQVRVSWDEAPTSIGPLQPLILTARRQDSHNFYGAELRQNVGGGLELRIRKTIGGTVTTLATAALGNYVLGSWWYVRFQLNGATLRARAWPMGSTQPTSWTLTQTDSSISSSGKVGIRSSNSSSDANPLVSFEGFRVHTLGLTVHAFMKPDGLDFTGTGPDNYIHWIGKGEADDWEYAFRFYPLNSIRPNRISAYSFNLIGGQGAGNYTQEPLTNQQWIQIVATYDPGDALDTLAGVWIFKNGALVSGPADNLAARYSHPTYLIYLMNGAAPLRIGSANAGTFFNGWIDEVAIFDRRLSAADVQALYLSSQ